MLLREDLKKIIREELERFLDEINRRGFLKGAAAMCAMGVQSACKQDYELRNYPDKNLDGMYPPDCLGKINLIFRHHDFEGGPIPEDFFFETYKDYYIPVKKDTGQIMGYNAISGIDYGVQIMFKNVPLESKSWDDFGLREKMESMEPYTRKKLRSFAFYFPVRNNLVYANQQHFNLLVNNSGAPGNWYNETWKWDFTFPIGESREDSVCEEEYIKFLEGPLKEPQKEKYE